MSSTPPEAQQPRPTERAGLDVERDGLLTRFDPNGSYDGWQVRMEITSHYARLTAPTTPLIADSWRDTGNRGAVEHAARTDRATSEGE